MHALVRSLSPRRAGSGDRAVAAALLAAIVIALAAGIADPPVGAAASAPACVPGRA